MKPPLARRLAIGCALTGMAATAVHCASSAGGPSEGEGDSEQEDNDSESDSEQEELDSTDGGNGNRPASTGGTESGEDQDDLDETSTCGLSPSQLPPAVAATSSQEEAPKEGLGGEVVPGVYVLTQWIHYPSETPPEYVPESMASVIILEEGGQGQAIMNWEGEPPVHLTWDEGPYFYSFEWLTASDYLGMNYTCPEDLVGDYRADHYSVIEGKLILYTNNKRAEVYTRQEP